MTNTPLDTLAAIDERWQNLTIANDFVFCKTMLDAELCREVLEAILGVPVERIEYVGRQEELDATPDRKSVRLDVYVRDASGSVYNVEMQAVDTHELPQRSRYYHSLLTLDQLGRGKPYKSLGNAYVIFICGFDPFGLGWRVYSFENSCHGAEQLKLGDGAKTVFLAASAPRDAQNDARLNELLDYVSSGEVTGELSAKLATAVANVLDNRKWRLEFMLLEVRDQLNFDRGEKLGREIGFAAGIEQGREEGFAEGAEHGRREGFAEGAEHGRREGLAEGAAQGEDKLSRLIALLLANNKHEDIELAVSNADQREGLYRAYGIE